MHDIPRVSPRVIWRVKSWMRGCVLYTSERRIAHKVSLIERRLSSGLQTQGEKGLQETKQVTNTTSLSKRDKLRLKFASFFTKKKTFELKTVSSK